jgi:hypothetical protein
MKLSITIISTILTALLISSPAISQGYQNQDAIYNLVVNEMIEVAAQGDTYNTVKISGTSLTDQDLHVVIPAGTFLDSRLNGVQNMVVINTEELDVPAGGTFEVTVQTASLETQSSIPVPSTRFTILDDFSSELTDLMQVIGDLDESYETLQAAVWIAADNADWEEMGILKDIDGVVVGYTHEDAEDQEGDETEEGTRLITEENVVQAMMYVEQAGLDIRRKHVWADHVKIMENLPEGELRDWLTVKINSA